MAYKDTEKEKAYKKAHNKVYHQRPEVKEKEAARGRSEKTRAYHRAYYAVYDHRPGMREKRRAGNVQRQYGLSAAAYNDMLADQGGVCASCRTSDWGKRSPHVDHDHKTGEVRGILCLRCNIAAGLLGDDPVRVAMLLAYLQGR